jgi:hypothetical protein
MRRSYDATLLYQDSYFGALSHFVACLETGQPFETEVLDNLETLRLVDAAYAQAQYV